MVIGRHLSWNGIALHLVLAVFLLVCLVNSRLTPHSQSDASELRVSTLILVDESGRERGRLSVSPAGPRLRLGGNGAEDEIILGFRPEDEAESSGLGFFGLEISRRDSSFANLGIVGSGSSCQLHLSEVDLEEWSSQSIALGTWSGFPEVHITSSLGESGSSTFIRTDPESSTIRLDTDDHAFEVSCSGLFGSQLRLGSSSPPNTIGMQVSNAPEFRVWPGADLDYSYASTDSQDLLGEFQAKGQVDD